MKQLKIGLKMTKPVFLFCPKCSQEIRIITDVTSLLFHHHGGHWYVCVECGFDESANDLKRRLFVR